MYPLILLKCWKKFPMINRCCLSALYFIDVKRWGYEVIFIPTVLYVCHRAKLDQCRTPNQCSITLFKSTIVVYIDISGMPNGSGDVKFDQTCWKPSGLVVKGLKQVTRLEFWMRLSLQDTDCVKAFEVHVCDSAGSNCRGRDERARYRVNRRGSRIGHLCASHLGQCHEMDIFLKV